jgi:hypothetical protein
MPSCPYPLFQEKNNAARGSLWFYNMSGGLRRLPDAAPPSAARRRAAPEGGSGRGREKGGPTGGDGHSLLLRASCDQCARTGWEGGRN